ncbi:hypothetical protein [Natronorubrum aibiense]|uniref:Enolase n=1 Tax=Natronorubrum aibiense TaxID=348826 RepID=A0A5P9P4Y5_9EURY|nr:hypothetical protein [Natronorubrum aibiense]QFU83219.1 hypothetical protein GCU68_12095 [Natronorubrum aibiense]
MTLYDRLADLPLTIETSERTSRRRETASEGTRVTSTFVLLSGTEFGAGEDVTHEVVDHEALPEPPVFDFAGEYTVDEFSRSLEAVDLFPTKPPEREVSRHYRRWALESAALDLALKQNDTTLAARLDRTRSPVRFVASAPVPDGDPTRVESILAVNSACEFKLSPTAAWSADTVETLAATDAVRVLDLQDQCAESTDDSQPAPERYQRVLEAFPDAIVEDPAVSDDVRPLLRANADRLSWDAPIHGVEDLRSRPFPPRWCTITPSRFGTVRSLLETIEYCLDHGIRMYGGGQSELCVGRGHIQLLASLFYPDGPNDVAPRSYNEPAVRTELRASPLEPPEILTGLEWKDIE